MKNILFGIILGSIVCPISATIFYLYIWLVYPIEDSNYTLGEWILGGAGIGLIGIAYAVIIIVVYGLPLFLMLRKLKLVNWLSCIVIALAPWVIIDGFINHDIKHFIEFSWYSLVSGGMFWFFARKTISHETTSA